MQPLSRECKHDSSDATRSVHPSTGASTSLSNAAKKHGQITLSGCHSFPPGTPRTHVLSLRSQSDESRGRLARLGRAASDIEGRRLHARQRPRLGGLDAAASGVPAPIDCGDSGRRPENGGRERGGGVKHGDGGAEADSRLLAGGLRGRLRPCAEGTKRKECLLRITPRIVPS